MKIKLILSKWVALFKFNRQLLKDKIKRNPYWIRDYINDHKKTFYRGLINIIKYFILLIIGTLIYDFQRTYLMDEVNGANILVVLTSTIGITSAIIITFVFSKLYSDKNDRIQRKIKIDRLSKKLTALRRISHFLRGSNEFWKIGKAKSNIDFKYKKIFLRDFLKMDYEQYNSFLKNIEAGEISAQAYLSLKEMEGQGTNSFLFFDSIWLVNYKLDDLAIYQDACRRIHSFLSEFNDKLDFTSISRPETEMISKNIKIIYPESNQAEVSLATFKKLFDDIPERIIRELYYLTRLNTKSFGLTAGTLLFNLVVMIIILIFSVILLSIKIDAHLNLILINAVVSIFIISVIDLILNVMSSIKKELLVEEFYDI